MQTIIAIYEDGVLKPTEPLDLPEHAEVRLTIEVLPAPSVTGGGLYASPLNMADYSVSWMGVTTYIFLEPGW